MTSTTLDLVDLLLARGRALQQFGRHHDALRLLTRLAGFRDLPAPAAEDVQFRLGEVYLRRRKYCRARRHLAAALAHGPDNPRYHYALARAFDNDRDGDAARAAEHYRTSLELDGTQVDCLCAFAALAINLGRADEAVPCLRAAAAQAPDDLKVLGKVVSGLRKVNRTEEARGLLLAARFRHPRDARYLALWNHFQFQSARREQEDARRAKASSCDDAPALLPFVRPARPTPTPALVAGRVLRHDGPSAPAPHLSHPARLPGQRHAQ